MPIFGAGGATPEREAGDARQVDKIVAQRKVVDQDQLALAGNGGQPRRSLGTAGCAPGGARGIGIGEEHYFIGTDGVGCFGPGQRAGLTHLGGPKAVVIEQKERSEQIRSRCAWPQHIGIFGGQHAEAATDIYPVLIFGDTAQPGANGRVSRVGRKRNCPQIMITGHPDHLGKAAR